MAQPAPPPGAGGVRPPAVTAAIYMLIVVGGLRALLGLIGLISTFGILSLGGFVFLLLLLVIVGIVVGVVQLLGGINALQGRLQRGYQLGFGGTVAALAVRILGIIIGLIALSGLGVGFGGLAFDVIFIAVDVVILVLLVQNKDYFAA